MLEMFTNVTHICHTKFHLLKERTNRQSANSVAAKMTEQS